KSVDFKVMFDGGSTDDIGRFKALVSSVMKLYVKDTPVPELSIETMIATANSFDPPSKSLVRPATPQTIDSLRTNPTTQSIFRICSLTLERLKVVSELMKNPYRDILVKLDKDIINTQGDSFFIDLANK
ncbi:hypothetical protein MBANPS3_012582, partial [Mucor bainieri]